MLNWTARTLAYDNEGMLYSAPVFAGYSVPVIELIVLVLICMVSLCFFTVQLKPLMPRLATKRFCVVFTPIVLIVVWFAYHSLVNYFGEMLWMYHS